MLRSEWIPGLFYSSRSVFGLRLNFWRKQKFGMFSVRFRAIVPANFIFRKISELPFALLPVNVSNIGNQYWSAFHFIESQSKKHNHVDAIARRE